MSIENSKKTKIQFFAGALVIFMVITVIMSSIVLFTGGPVNAASEETSISETEGEAEKETPVKSDNSAGLAYISAALPTGLACIGAGIAVAITGSAALGAISEDPKLLGKTLIFVGLSEGIAIYGLIISIMILNKV
jgi:F0F1-type ATP synthase membrane subunit c/vacuolar-type H+-ATPase subunit K